MIETRGTGIVLLCDDRGIILKVIRDDLNIVKERGSERSLISFLDQGSQAKVSYFLLEIKSQRISRDWQLNIFVNGNVMTFYFYGAVSNDGLLIIGAVTREVAYSLYEELLLINDEKFAYNKDYGGMSLESDIQVIAQHKELSHLNNEIFMLKRELSKKNVELENLKQKLEDRITERTAELTKSNKLLLKEIETRKLTERKLQRALLENVMQPGISDSDTIIAAALEDVERKHIMTILERTGWRVKGKDGAAEILRLKPTTLQSRMKKLGIKRP